MAEVTIRIGKPVDKSAAAKRKTVEGKKPRFADVEAQGTSTEYFLCWNCWAVSASVVHESSEAITIICWNCGYTVEV
jgi:hypothetical protein